MLISNLSKVDILTAPNNQILNFYHDLVQRRDEEFLLYFERFHNLLSNFTFEQANPFIKNTTGKVRIGLILDQSQGQDLKTIEKPIISLLEKHKQEIEIIIFGWSGKTAEQYGVFKNLRISYEKPVPFYDYHSRLNSLAFDIGLIPLLTNEYNVAGKGFNRFLDFSGFKIPSVVPAMLPFKNIVNDGENGFIAFQEDDWINKADQLISNVELRREVGNNAFKTVWEKYSYTPKTMQRLKSVFI